MPATPGAAPVSLDTLFGNRAGGEAAGSAAYRAKLARPGYGYLRSFVEPALAHLDRGGVDPEEQTRAHKRLDDMFAVSHSPDGHGMPEIKQASNDYHAALGAEVMQAFRPSSDPAAFAPEAARHAASYGSRLEDGVQLTAVPHGEGVELRIAPNDWRDYMKPVLIGAAVIGVGVGVGYLIYRAFTGPSKSPGETLLDAADQVFADVAQRALPGATVAIADARTHKITLDDRSFTIRLMMCPLGDRQVKPIVNPTKDAHVLQLSEHLADHAVARALAGGIAEIAELRRVVQNDEFPIDQDMLRRGPVIESQNALSARDVGAVAEIRELCAQHKVARRQRASEIFLELVMLVDQLGLRDDEGAGARWALIKASIPKADRELVTQARTKELQPQETDLLDQGRQRLDEQRQERDKYEAPLHELPDPEQRVSLEQAELLAEEARQRRALKSQQTLQTLREGHDDAPRVRDPQIGGGAALTAVRPDQHLIDDRGRWQKDPSHALAQTAIQLRAMLPAGLGDPLQFVERPNDRLPLAAVRYFEDSIAAQADVVDGTATLSLDSKLGMVVHIHPSDGQGDVDAVIEGTPLIASGFPRERVPGQRALSTYGAITRLMDLLDTITTPGAQEAREALAHVDLSDHAAIADVLEPFQEAVEALKELTTAIAALGVLGLHGEWSALQDGRGERVLQGDHANLETLNPKAADIWVIAGVGGTSISAAEIILRGHPEAKVTMIGGTPPNGLNTNDQFVEVYNTYGPCGENRFDVITGHRLDKPVLEGETLSVDQPLSALAQIDDKTTKATIASTEPASWLALALGHDQLEAVEHVLTENRKARVKLIGATIPHEVLSDDLFKSLVATHGPTSVDPRLEIASGAGLGELEEGPRGGVQTTGKVSGAGYVNTLGRGGQASPLIEDLLRRARFQRHQVTGELLWSDDEEYLGYRIRIASDTGTHAFDVTGAASRFLPEGVFSSEERDLVMAREGVTPIAAAHDAPPEGGNFDGGFAASATQAARYGRFVRRDRELASSFREQHNGEYVVALRDVAESSRVQHVCNEVAGALKVKPERVTAIKGEVTETTVTFWAKLGVADLGTIRGQL